MTSSIRGLRVKLPFLNLNEYGVELERFAITGHASMRGPPVYALPHLSVGSAIFLFNHIPYDCPFKTYDDIRKHWKNQVGSYL